MGLTSNIIESELAGLGTLCRRPGAGTEYEDARRYLGPESLTRADVLYLCDDPGVPARHEGFSFLCVQDSPAAPAAANGAPANRGSVSRENRFKPECPDRGSSESKPPATAAAFSLSTGRSVSEVHARLQDAFLKYRQWEERLDRSCMKGEGIQALLDLSTPILRNNIVVVDPALKLLAYTRDVPCDDPVTMELIEHGYHTEDNIRKFKLHKRFAPWASQDGFIVNDTHEICKYVTVVHSFKTRDSFSLIVVMMCNQAEPDAALLDALTLLLGRIGYYAEREYPDSKPAGNATDAFLRDLITGACDDEAAVRERCESVGIPFEASFCLFYTAVDAAAVPVSRLLADAARETAPAKVLLVGNAVVVLCFNCFHGRCGQHCQSALCPLQNRAISRRFDHLLDRYDLDCGRSSQFSNLLQARCAYLQARQAASLGPAMAADPHGFRPTPPRKHIFTFDRCCLDYLVARGVEEGENLAQMTHGCQVLSAIAKADAANNTDNYRFLYYYLAHERRTSLVADELHMHRNNVKYRIDKIEEAFGIDTSDPLVRLDLTIAYFARDAEAAKGQADSPA